MAETAREYLMHRFRGDAQSLRERAASLKSGTKMPGPDAATSARMADACEQVVQMLEAIGTHDELSAELAALSTLIPRFEAMSRGADLAPPVRAVFAGAATRIREVESAEANARSATSNRDTAGDDDAVDEDGFDDADLDDDDLDTDETR